MNSGPPVPVPPVRRETVTVDGLDLAVLVARPAPELPAVGPPVLAVHGFASSAQQTWERTGHLRELVRAGRTVVAPDLPGHGLSSRPVAPQEYSLERLCRVVVAAATALAPAAGPLDLVGYSLGARVSAELLAAAPGRWRRAVLGGYDGRALFDGVDVTTLRTVLAGRPTAVTDAATRRIAQLVAAVPGNDPHALAALVTALRGVGPGPALPLLPVLLVAGTEDPLADRVGSLAATSPLAEVLLVPGRDHVSAVPAATYRRGLVQFLAAGLS